MTGMLRFVAAPMMAALLFWFGVMRATSAEDNPPSTSNRSKSNGNDLVKRLMTFDKNKDGKLEKDEISDERLLGLFNRADRNRDGIVTESEIRALLENSGRDGFGEEDRRVKGGRGEGGRGEKGGRGMGERGQRGSNFGGQPGQILPTSIRGALRLTEAQNREIDDLQREATSRMEKILTDEQKSRLRGILPGGNIRGRGKRD